jgi:hypothetical protein
MTDFERIVEFYPAHDDFDPIKRTGSRSFMRIKFILKGPNGAVQFMVGTVWGLQRSDASTARLLASNAVEATRPTGCDVGYHSPVPQYEGQTSMECDLLPGGLCYYDGSGCRADEWVPGFIAGGSDWVWQKLEQEYADLFASAGEAGTAETTKIGSVHERATAEGGDAQTQSPTPKGVRAAQEAADDNHE